MKIMLVETGQAGGGSFGSLYTLIASIDRDKYVPIVVFLNRTHWVDKIACKGIKVIVLKDCRYSLNANKAVKRVTNFFVRRLEKLSGPTYLRLLNFIHHRTIKRIVALARAESVDLVHMNNQPNRDFFGAVAARRLNIPCISHIRSHKTDGYDNSRAVLLNGLYDHYIAASFDVLKHWSEKGLDKSKSSVIYNGVNFCSDEQNDYQDNLLQQNHACHYGAVGSLIVIKGHDFLIRTFLNHHENYPADTLTIAGQGPERDYLEKTVRDLNLSQYVKFVGHIADMDKFYQGIDILIHPSIEENCSRVLLEAMSYGVPITASTAGGTPELIVDQHNGLTFDYGDRLGLLECMDTIRGDLSLRKLFIENSKKRVAEKFSIDSYVTGVCDVYQKVLLKH